MNCTYYMIIIEIIRFQIKQLDDEVRYKHMKKALRLSYTVIRLANVNFLLLS